MTFYLKKILEKTIVAHISNVFSRIFSRLNGVADRVQFINQDLTSARIVNSFPDKFDVLVSNPPYVSPADFEDLPEEIKNYEPTVALNDNRDGLSFYRKIAEFSPELIKASGFLMLELGLGQAQAVKEIFLKTRFYHVGTFQDLNEIDRILFFVGIQF